MALNRCAVVLLAAAFILAPRNTCAQALTGSLIGTVKDEQGAALVGAQVRISSPALLGGPLTVTTNDKGQLRVPSLPPGSYTLDVEFPNFATSHEEGMRIGVGATIERAVVLKLAAVAQSVTVEGSGSPVETRDPGFVTRFGVDEINAIPTRRSSMFDWIRAAPGVSPTSPSSGTVTTVSVFGSGTNENGFLIDGTNFTCPCSGNARTEPGVDFIQEIQIQSAGASAEFGNIQGGIINVVTKQGSARLQYDASYYGQSADLTSQPVRLPVPRAGGMETGYERARFRDFSATAGGPVLRDRLWFFGGYQYLRDYDSQPGTLPQFPRTYEQDKFIEKLTWKPAPGWQFVQSVHYESWLNPVSPTLVTPFEATTRLKGSIPAITFGHLTHTTSGNTIWDVRVGRFVYSQDNAPATGDWTTPGRTDRVTGVNSGAPATLGSIEIARTTAKATLHQYRPAVLGGDHEWKVGIQVERGEHDATVLTPGGTRYIDSNGAPFQAVSRAPSVTGGLFTTAALFASDTITFGDRLTVSAGLRYDYNRGSSQDLPARDPTTGEETDQVVPGLGHLYTWNIVSPRLGATVKLSDDGRTVLRGTYGRFNQGILTGEFEPFHPGMTPTTTTAFDPATGGYTRLVSVVDPRINLVLDRHTRAPHTDEYSVGLDRDVGHGLAVAVAYVGKRGADFIGWTDTGGVYRQDQRTLTDGRALTVYELVNATTDRRFLLTNAPDYSMVYNGLVVAFEKRQSHGWHASGSYTLSRSYGLMASSGASASGPQVSTVGPPVSTTFGRDPNDLTNTRGRLPNDRPHVFRLMGSVVVPRTGFVVAANLQYFSGKPWAETTQVSLTQGDQRIFLETRGSRRLPSQSLLDLRVSRTIALNRAGRIELLVDVLNALNDSAAESIATDNYFSSTFGQPTLFMDPRRAMFGIRASFGR